MKLTELCHPHHTSAGITPAAETKRAALRKQAVACNALVAAKAACALAGVADHLRAIHELLPHGAGWRGSNTAARHQVEALRAELLKALSVVEVTE